MATNNPFQRAEDEYFRVKGQFITGRITREQFEATLKDLMVEDVQGRYWMLGVDTGRWYVNDGQTWVEAEPSVNAMPGTLPAPAMQAPPRQSRRVLWLAIGSFTLLLLLGIAAIFLAMNQGVLKIGVAATPTLSFRTPIPTLWPAPTAAPLPAPPLAPALAPTAAPPTGVITSGQALPDLVVEIVSIDSTTIVRNQTPWVWLHYRVKNTGAGATPAGMKIRLCSYSNNARNSGYLEVKELASGESAEGRFAVASDDYWPLGAQTIHLQVDYENAIVERNETNNLSNFINVQVTAPTAPVTPTATTTRTPPATSTPILIPTATSTLLPPPGVYVTRLRMEPPNPNAVENIRFFATFLNTAGPLQFKWCVFIYNLGATNARGQTSCDQLLDFPAGTYEYATINTWRLGPGTPCTDLVARVQGIDTGGGRFLFKMPDLSENSFSFRVCP